MKALLIHPHKCKVIMNTKRVIDLVLEGNKPDKALSLVIFEGRYDKLTTEISGWIVSMMKSGRGPHLKRRFRDLRVEVYVDTGEGYYATNVSGTYEYNNNKINILIEVPENFPISRRTKPGAKGWKPYTWENLIAELKSTIRHELEHSGQEKTNVFSPDLVSTHGLIKYYTNPREVAAYVSGMYKKAKATRVPFYYLLSDHMSRVEDSIIRSLGDLRSINRDWVKEQVNGIRDAYVRYAEKRYPKAAGIGDTPLIPKKYRTKRLKYQRRDKE